MILKTILKLTMLKKVNELFIIKQGKKENFGCQ